MLEIRIYFPPFIVLGNSINVSCWPPAVQQVFLIRFCPKLCYLDWRHRKQRQPEFFTPTTLAFIFIIPSALPRLLQVQNQLFTYWLEMLKCKNIHTDISVWSHARIVHKYVCVPACKCRTHHYMKSFETFNYSASLR